MRYSSKTINRYSNMYPRMILSLSKKRFDIFVEIVWWNRKRFHKGESKTIFPCMLGEYIYEGEMYICTMEGVKKVENTEKGT